MPAAGVAALAFMLTGSEVRAAPPAQGGGLGIPPPDPAGFIIDYVGRGGSGPVALTDSQVTPFDVGDPNLQPGDPGCSKAGTDWAKEPTASPNTGGNAMTGQVAKGPHGDYGFSVTAGCYYIAVVRGATVKYSPVVGVTASQPVKDLNLCWQTGKWFAGPTLAGDPGWTQAEAACPAPADNMELILDPGTEMVMEVVGGIWPLVVVDVVVSSLVLVNLVWRLDVLRLFRRRRTSTPEASDGQDAAPDE